MGVNAIRVSIPEGAYTFRDGWLSGALMEMDMFMSGANCFLKIIRSDGLISNAQFYRDPAKTDLSHEMFFDRVSGADGISRIVGVSSVFYNADTSTDSVVSGGIDRASGEPFEIECCSGFFYTDEDTKI